MNYYNPTDATPKKTFLNWRLLKKLGLLSVAFVLLNLQMAFAASGIFNSFASINGTFYDASATTANADFQGASIGTFTIGTGFTLNGEVQTFKNVSDNICGGRIYYSIYPTSGVPGLFTQLNLPFQANLPSPGDQQWGAGAGAAINLSSLTPGAYKIAIYVGASGDASGGCTVDPFHTVNNSGAYYIANFTAVGAQPVTVTGTAAGSYATLAAAISALNTAATMTTPTNVYVNPGYSETASIGGYALTATGSAANTLTFNGNGAILTSPTQASGILHDAVFEVIGSDFITFDNIKIRELSTNTVVASATNTCTEWGIALQYATTTNGCQNITIKNCDIQLNRAYTNSFGIYQNSTHASTTITVAASATTTVGSNSNLVIQSNLISNVNEGIFILGPIAAADFSNTIIIGGATAALGNTITNYGSGTRLSGFANAPTTTISAIYVRNSIAATIQNNIISSNAGTWSTTATLTGINLPTSSVVSAATYTTTISNNTINLTHGVVGASMNGIVVSGNNSSPTSSIIINANNFTGATNTVALATSTCTGISMTAPYLTTSITNNIWTNISYAASGLFTFCSHSHTMPVGGSETITGNNIVGTWVRTVSGTGGITGITTGGGSPSGTSSTVSNNNFSNINNIGTGAIILINQTDGAASGNNPAKTITNNTFNNITTGTGTFTGIVGNWLNGITASITSSISNNTITNVTGQGSITGILLGSNGGVVTTTGFIVNANTINNLNSTVTGGTVIGINASAQTSLDNIVVSNHTIFNLSSTGASTVVGIAVGGGNITRVSKNKIYALSNSNALGSVNGIAISGGIAPVLSNNLIGDLTAPVANAANPVIGINITGGTNANVYYNTVRLSATSTGALFGSSAVNIGSASPVVNLRNNIFVNTGTANGSTTATVALRRNTRVTTNYASTSNNNLFYAGTPSATNLLYMDSTLLDAVTLSKSQTIAQLKTALASEASSATFSPVWVSTTGANANYLHIDGATASPIESGGAPIIGFDDDYDADIRQGSSGYVGAGTAPDMGADEFAGLALPCTTPAVAVIATTTSTRCVSQTVALTSTGASSGAGYSYQWKVSTTSGSGYANVVGGTGATTTAHTSDPLVAGTYYYILQTTCNNGPSVSTSNQITVEVNALPTIAVTPASGAVCNPGGTAVALTASSASATSYAWLPITGLTPANAASTSALPLATTTYTVSGTDAVGCIGTTTVVINVGALPTFVSTTATSPICVNGTSTLGAVAQFVNTSSLANYTFSASTTPYTPIIGGTVTANLSDDTYASATIGFNFNYLGTAYTAVNINSNGTVYLGATTTSTQPWINSLATKVLAIGGLWDDNHQATGSNSYLLSGVAPNRIFTVQWTNTAIGGGGSQSNPTNNYQIRLHESGKIEFAYGALTDANALTASIGISGAVAGQFISITPGAIPTASSATENSSISSVAFIPSGTVYALNPVSSITNFSWADAAKILGSNTVANPTTSSLATTTTYTVTAINGFCSATSTVQVAIGGALTNSVSASGASACNGVQTITATAVGGGAPYSYAWLVDGSAIAPTSATIPAVLGSHIYVSTVTDACGTTVTTTSASIVTFANPIGTASYNAPTCVGQPLTVSATSNIASSFQWSGPALFAGTINSVLVTTASTIANQGVYTVTIFSDANASCTATYTTNVVVNALPTVNATTTTPIICASSPAILLATPVYCTPTVISGSCASDEFISNVTLGSINNTTTCGPSYTVNAYENFSALSTNLVAGTSYTLTATVTAFFSGDILRGYFDWNNDGDFLDANEDVLGVPAAGANASTIVFTVPVGASNGSTRMRIRLTYTTGNTSCGASSFGNIEDYTLNISGGANAAGFTWSPGALSGSLVTPSPSITTIYTVTSTNGAGCSAISTVEVVVNPQSTLSVSTANVTCNGLNNGDITVVTDGTFTITPSFAANNYPTGAYTVTSSGANGCTKSTTITITEPALLMATATLTQAIECFNGGGEVTVASTGGILPITGTGTFTNVLAGVKTYTVTDANGCTSSTSITLLQPTNLVLTVSTPTPIACNGQLSNVTISFSGGTTTGGNYSYGIDNGSSVITAFGAGTTYSLTAGTYTISLEDDNACIKSQVIVISQPSTLLLSAVTTTIISCNGGNATVALSTTGGTGIVTFTKSNGTTSSASSGANSLAAGSWSITATDANGCVANTSISITQPTPVVASAMVSDDVDCFGGNAVVTVSATGGAGGYFGIGNYTVTASAIPYSYTVIDANGCSANTSITVSQPTQITASSAITSPIACFGGNAIITVTSTGGTTPYTFGGGTTYTVSTVAGGAYTYSVTDAKGCSITTSISVTQPTLFKASIAAGSPIACKNGTSTYTVTGIGGTTPYFAGTLTLVGVSKIYTVASGTYSNTLIDANGCVANTSSISFTNPLFLEVDITAAVNPILIGATLDLTATSATAVSYTWSGPGTTGTSSTPNVYGKVMASVADYGQYTVTVTNSTGCITNSVINIEQNRDVNLRLKVLLTGPLQSSGLMNADLTTLLPSTTPYQSAPYAPFYALVPASNMGGETMLPIALTNTGADAIVDWVFVQLRSKTNSSVVISTRSALIKRNGFVVDMDGSSDVLFTNVGADDYFVSVLHRNHLGVMGANTYNLSNSTVVITDFTDIATPMYSRMAPNNNPTLGAMNSTRSIGGKRALFAGNANISTAAVNKYITYNSTIQSDRSSLFVATGATGTLVGYSVFDVNMDGVARFNGLNPDRLMILQNCFNSNTLILNQQTPN